MAMALESILRHYPHPYITESEIEALLRGTADSRYGKVKRLLAQGKLLHIRRGLYCLTAEMGYSTKPHPYELAQYIYGLSYISFESALSFHQLIPETVYTITSATGKRSNEFKTPIGTFSYLHLPLENLYTGVELINDNGYHFLMAKPWKAICDYVYCSKNEYDNLHTLIKSMRINIESLPLLRNEERQLLDDYYHHSRVSHFLNTT